MTLRKRKSSWTTTSLYMQTKETENYSKIKKPLKQINNLNISAKIIKFRRKHGDKSL